MAELTVQDIVQAGLSPTLVAAAAGGDTFDNDGRTFFHIDNGGGASITVTFAQQAACSIGVVGDHDIAVAVLAGEERMIGPFEKHIFDDSDEEVEVTYSGVTTVTVGAIKL